MSLSTALRALAIAAVLALSSAATAGIRLNGTSLTGAAPRTKGDRMPVVTIPVGSYSIWTLNVTAANGQADTTSPITATAAQSGFVQIDPVSSSAGNRQFYVTGLLPVNNLSLIATTQAGKQVFVQIEVSQPDLSGITSAGFGPVQPGPHP